jgi:hypothetical protein
MTALLWALKFVRRLPVEAWVAIAAGVLTLALIRGVHDYGAKRYDQGRRDAAAGIVFDSATLARAAEVVVIKAAKVDTITRTVIQTRRKVDTLIVALPPEVVNVPEVKALVTTVQTLTVQVDSLVVAHTAERAAWTEKARVDSSAIYALRVMNTAQRDTIVTLEKRPRWRTVVTWTLTGAAAGFVAGVVR